MSTLAELKATIASDLHRDDLTVLISDEISRACDYYSGDHFWFLEGTATITTAASQSEYSVPTDFGSIVGDLMCKLSGQKYPISVVSYEEINEIDGGVFTSIPSKIAYFNNKFRIYPIPNGVYEITLSYHKTLDAPSDTASNAWTTDAFNLIRYHVERKIYQSRLRDWDAARASKENEEDEYIGIVSDSTQKMSSSRVRKSL